SRAIKDKTDELLKKTRKKSAKVIEDADLSDIFGIEMDKQPNFSKNRAPAIKSKAKAVKKRASTKRSNKPVTPPLKQPTQKAKQKSPKTPKTATDLVAKLIITSKTGNTIENLAIKTGYSKIKLYGIVHRLKQQGKIKKEGQRVYKKA
ncbi:MAG: hypothetical protein U9Q58_09775, partial [Pseudomonadota bacterium]|nr:hypothetical protein [Pseudomonadota bacterium]